ncbi:MAG TPA: NAD(+) diphosphatase [Jiangellaceae bacterium]
MDPTPYALRQPLALTRSVVDRAGDRRRDERWLADAWADHRTRVLVVAGGTAPMADGHLVLVCPSEAPEGERFLLGVDHDGIAHFAVALAGPHPDARAVGLRQASLSLDDRDGGLLVHAIALANWHATHGHCSRCGAPTQVAEAGHLRRCPEDGSEHHPRTDPVIIVLVVDDADRCLLGRHPDWPPGRYSTLAGFVEPGETPEQAVAREVCEETRVTVTSCTYAGSQPWPFPSNLMLGFYGRAAGEEPKPDGEEISDARWFSRADLAAAIEAGEVVAPPSVAISRRLIEGWYGSDLPVTR